MLPNHKELAMAAVGGEGLEKLEDMIVRTAEASADHVRAAKAAIVKRSASQP